MDINKPNSVTPFLNHNSDNSQLKSIHSRLQNPFLTQIDEYLEENFFKMDLSNTDIAQHFGFSTRQLYRILDRATGLTPNQYITKFRMQKAKILLKSRQHFTAKKVAILVGYKKSSYFSQLFKKEFHETPFEFLRRIGVRQS